MARTHLLRQIDGGTSSRSSSGAAGACTWRSIRGQTHRRICWTLLKFVAPLYVSCFFDPNAVGQISFAGTQVVVAGQGLSTPSGLSTDGQGNLYIADRDNGRILRMSIAASNYGPAQTVVTGLASPQGVAADWYGNLFVAETGANRVVEFPVTSGAYGPSTIVATGLSSPGGVAVDQVSNVYVADSGNNRILSIRNLGNSFSPATSIGSGFSNPQALAVDALGNVYVADTGNSCVDKLALKNGVYAAPLMISRGVIDATAIAVDNSYNLYVTNAINHQLMKYPWLAAVGYYYPPFAIGGNFGAPQGVAVSPQGQVFVSNAGKNIVQTLQPSTVSFPTVPVGATTPSQEYDFNVVAGTTIGSVAVYSQGLANQEFVDAGDSTCTPQVFVSAALCVVDVTLTPQASGLRSGAIVLYDGSGNPLATAFLSGSGTASKAALFPGKVSLLGSELSGPSGVTVDANGNVFIADTGNDRVVELPWNGSSYGSQSTLPVTGISSPMGLAIDGVGNLYIASSDSDRVIKMLWSGDQFGKQTTVGTALYGPSGVSVDAAGNVYIADTYNNSLWKVPWTGTSYRREAQIANWSKLPVGVASDPAGNVFFTVPYANGLIEKPFVNGVYMPQIPVPLTGPAFPSGIAIDGNGNLFVADTNNNRVIMLSRTNGGFGKQITIASGLNAPAAVAVDSFGNLYIADTGDDIVVKVDVSAASSLAFANTNVGSTSVDSPQSALFVNIGNLPLALGDIAYPPDFPAAAPSSTACLPLSSIQPGGTCVLSVNFSPLQSGTPLQEQIAVSDNEGTVSGSQRIVTLTGTAQGRATQSIAIPPLSDIVFGAPPLLLPANASSHLPITYQVLSGPATLTRGGTTLSINGVGTVLLQAAQSGNAAYLPADSITVSFNVLPAILTVAPSDVTATYGAIPKTFSYVLSGFVNGQTASQVVTGNPVISLNALPSCGVGSYMLTASLGTLAASNYTFAFSPGKLTVRPALLQVVANSKSAAFGGSLPVLSWAAAGWQNGDTAGVLQGAPLLTTTANTGSPVGSYPISIASGSLVSANYSFQFFSATLTIVPAVVTIAASNLVASYGTPLPPLTWTVTGLLQGDSLGVIHGLPLVGTTATQGADAGTYVITVSAGSLSASNYAFRFASGQLVIQKVPLHVTASNATIDYGQPRPALTFALNGFVNGDSPASAITGNASLTTLATTSPHAGTYPISVAAGSLYARNYTFVFDAGVLTVRKATLTVTPRASLATYGSAVPALAYDLFGFVFADNASAVQGSPSLSTIAGQSSPVGSYPIHATIGSLIASDYTFQFNEGTLTVEKAAISVTPMPVSMTYGGTVPPLLYSLSGFVNSDDARVVTGQPSLMTLATPSSGVGIYAITGSVGTLTSANYSFTFLPGKLTIAKAQLTVLPDPATIAYGGAVPSFTYAFAGFVNGDTAQCVSGKPFLWTSAPPSATVGTYSINGSVGTLVASNYTFVVSSGVYTVAKAILTITATPVAITYGAPSPAFSYSLTGFVHGENTGAINGTASLTSPFTATSPAGVYAIVASVGTLTAANYTFQTVDATLTVKKALLTLTPFDTTMTYGSSLPPLTYSLSGFVNGDTPSVISGSPLLTSPVLPTSHIGTYNIVADVRGMSAASYSFQAATGRLDVTRAQLLVTPNAVSVTYGATPHFTYVISGLLNGDSPSVVMGSPLLSSDAPDNAGAGTYTITGIPGSLAASNYSFTIGTASLTIDKAVLKVSGVSTAMVYGSTPPALSYSLSGFVRGEGAAVLTGTPAVTTDCSPSTPAGTCSVFTAPGSLAAANYSFQFVSGKVTVNKAVLTVSSANQSITYGALVPPFTYQVTGFLNGDTSSVIAGQPQISTTAASAPNAGSYWIKVDVTSMTAANYTFQPVFGQLTIAKALLTVTPINASMTYGSSLPAISSSLSGFVNGDSPSVVSGSPVLTTGVSPTSHVGTYNIVADVRGMTAANYSFQAATGRLDVTRAQLVVTPNAISVTYGATPHFTYVISGLLNGDSLSVVMGSPLLSSNAPNNAGAGTYTITGTLGSLAASNYFFTVGTASLTIDKAVLKVSGVSTAMVYGSTPPTPSYQPQRIRSRRRSRRPHRNPRGHHRLLALDAGRHVQRLYSAGSLAAANYSFQFVSGKVTVNKAAPYRFLRQPVHHLRQPSSPLSHTGDRLPER